MIKKLKLHLKKVTQLKLLHFPKQSNAYKQSFFMIDLPISNVLLPH